MNETPRAAQAWTDYLALGPDRSLEKLAALYQRRPGSSPTRLLSTLKLWSGNFGWQERLRVIAEQEAHAAAEREAVAVADLQSKGIASRENRIAAYNDRWERCQQVITARATDPVMEKVPGGKTGLLVRTFKVVGAGPTAYEVDEFAVDTGLLKEMRELEKQAAIEVGQWAEKKELTGANGGPIEVRDAREELNRRIAGLASRLGASEPAGEPEPV